MDLFSTEYFAWIRQGSLRSAREIVPLICQLKKPSRVIDIACGTGEWLSVFREHGATTLLGVDAQWIDPRMLNIREDEFCAHDLTEPPEIDGTFDLALMLEAIQHVPRDRARAMVATLARLAPVVVLSAPIPHQGGSGKDVNEQWPAYWAELFEECGFECIDAIRHTIWNNPRVEWWYAQNMLIFASREEIASNPAIMAARMANPGPPLQLIHPRLYLDKMVELGPQPKTAAERIARAMYRRLKVLWAPITRRAATPTDTRTPEVAGEGRLRLSDYLVRRN